MCTLHVRPVQPAPLSFPPVSLLLALPPSLLLLSKTHQDACSESPLRRSHRSPLSRSPLSFSLCVLSHRSSPPSRRPLLLASGCPSPLPPPPSFCFATQPPLQLVRSPVTDLDVDSSDARQSSNSASATTHHSLVSKPQPSFLLRHTLPLQHPMSSRFSSSRRSSVMDRMRNLSVVEEEAPVNEFGQISQSCQRVRLTRPSLCLSRRAPD